MSKLQDFVDENENGYQNTLLDIRNAIKTYGTEILFEALVDHVTDHVINNQQEDLTMLATDDTMVIH